ncbi:MAG: hypothetical protein Q4E37_01400 [Tissierellia bacterium]|nr:hypothetical protein [Tissierellia bacterium]
MKEKSEFTGGVGLLEALALIFIALKLTGHINWSWVWVLAPIWIPIAILGIIIIFAYVIKFVIDRFK